MGPKIAHYGRHPKKRLDVYALISGLQHRAAVSFRSVGDLHFRIRSQLIDRGIVGQIAISGCPRLTLPTDESANGSCTAADFEANVSGKDLRIQLGFPATSD